MAGKPSKHGRAAAMARKRTEPREPEAGILKPSSRRFLAGTGIRRPETRPQEQLQRALTCCTQIPPIPPLAEECGYFV